MLTSTANSIQVLVSYYMNRPQRPAAAETLVVTPGDADRVVVGRVPTARMSYQHPVHTPQLVAE
ncbi:hypothetical protein R6V09_49810 [Streptomyces sp. W16]|uniref:hypothetical protein n=1 Tax=Streptomyces sp. W16 TaxID=3076631 RepID=UPI00295BDDE3|nr:hypothetical protein [Streptomyces sp. W16]MDV9178204.1 hypothetical protein [Streptomyces sp. W16]